MAGGIQVGTEAGSVDSKRLDGDVKVVSEAMAQAQRTYFYESGHRSLDETKNFSRKTIVEAALPEMKSMGVSIGCMPDGGMWFSADRDSPRQLQFAFEAKYQQDGGNAIERWAKNYLLCYRLNPDVKYVTFMSGEGAAHGGVLHRFGESMTQVNGPNCMFYYEPEGFSQEAIFNIMNSVLELDLTFDRIRPFLNRRITNNFSDLFETTEQREKRIADQNERMRLEEQFSRFAQDPTDPLYPVWHRLPREHKSEAQEIVIEMMQAGTGNVQIASELVACFLK